MINKKLTTSFIKLVNILSDGLYHDGTTIGEKLKMTRSAVWKAIKKLESYGVRVDSVKGKGYALLEPLTLLDVNKIKKNLHEKINITIFESIASTSNYLQASKDRKSIKLCLAEEQTQGRGRLSREWYGPFGQNIYLSCSFSFQKDVSELAGLSLVTGLAVYETLQSLGVKDHLYVKWPNDVIYANKKLAGILIEIQAETHGMSHAVIGIGINVNMLQDEDNISQAWTSVRKVLGEYVDRNEVCARLINKLITNLRHFAVQGFSAFIDEWDKADGLMNHMITVKNNNQEAITGKMVGINQYGNLLLRLKNGDTRAFSSGDTTIMK